MSNPIQARKAVSEWKQWMARQARNTRSGKAKPRSQIGELEFWSLELTLLTRYPNYQLKRPEEEGITLQPTTLTGQATFKGSLLGMEEEWESLGKEVKPQSTSVIKGSKRTQLLENLSIFFLISQYLLCLSERNTRPPASLLWTQSTRCIHRHWSHKRELSTAAIFSQSGLGPNGLPLPTGPGESANNCQRWACPGHFNPPVPHPILLLINSNLKVWS